MLLKMDAFAPLKLIHLVQGDNIENFAAPSIEPFKTMEQDPLNSPPQNAPNVTHGRFAFIDGLRAIACLSVFAFHAYTLGIFHGQLMPYVPKVIDFAIARGNLGVQVFFVLSGFVVAYSHRNARVTPGYLGNFALRRMLRLDPAYWTALAAVVLLSASPLGKDVPAQYVPSVKQFLINVFYLQGLSRSFCIISVSWTLCYEVQFYLVLTILIGTAQWLARKYAWREFHMLLALSLPLGLVSVCIAAGIFRAPFPGLFIDLWYMFYLGCLLWWQLAGRISPVWFWTFALTVASTLLNRWHIETGTVIATALLIFAIAKAGRLTNSLNNRVIQFFGRTSYSIYLFHGFICVYVLDIGRKITGDAPLPALGWIALAFAITVLSAWLVHRFIERPGIALGKRLKAREIVSNAPGVMVQISAEQPPLLAPEI